MKLSSMTKILPIIIYPNKILRKKSVEILGKEITDEKMKRLVDNMIETMKKKDGIGLAAPQIGKNIRLITVSAKDGVLVMFNPKITSRSWFREWGEEGCLSFPNIFGSVERHKKITARFLNEKGKKEKIKAKGLLARVIQHEIDHLNGVLFIDKAKNIQKIEKY